MQNSSTLERSEILDTKNLLLNLAKHIVRLIAGIADALIPLGAGHANTPDREGFSAGRLRILSLIPGRVRLHLSGWTAGDVEWVETRLCQVNGVESVQANPLTGNVLIRFDRRTTGEKTLLVELKRRGRDCSQHNSEWKRRGPNPVHKTAPATRSRGEDHQRLP